MYIVQENCETDFVSFYANVKFVDIFQQQWISQLMIITGMIKFPFYGNFFIGFLQ